MSQTENRFTHLGENDQPRMVDVSEKAVTPRTAIAEALIWLGPELAELLKNSGKTKKGPVLETANIAGIQGCKKTSDLIPMWYPLPLFATEVEIQLEGEQARVRVQVKTTNKTGVEMEALTGASVAALTLYDMCKSVSKAMVIESIKLIEKTGGKSGDYVDIERACSYGDEVGGHHVSGHVDCIGIIKKIYNSPNNRDVVVSCDKQWLAYLIPKGWITVDGVSLTVVDVGDNWFSVSLIPETLKQTVLGLKTEGQKVNLEFDHTVKVIVHTIERMLPEIKENAQSNLKKVINNKV